MTPPKTNGKAIASMVLGILSVMILYIGFILGILAIIFAALSFKELKRGYEQGKGMAIAGLVCGIIGVLLWGLILLFVVLAVAFFGSDIDSSTLYDVMSTVPRLKTA
ncbi:DUF4190 domain-containing protein [Paenibacillus cellulositrophicus]|uniref:DUF4190 domain-containing protein n=1 Tax=Paenibacillus cellulositrophicus TaxID=562959 RepID=UPI0012675015|nr:DUF4190 domain-containing protein [Paenibacillus cellulositrophicus]